MTQDDSGFFFAGTTSAKFVNSSTRCAVPGCGQPARIVDGTYEFVDGVLSAMRPLASRAEWEAVLRALDRLADGDFEAAIDDVTAGESEPVTTAIRALPAPESNESVTDWSARMKKSIAALLAAVGIGGAGEVGVHYVDRMAGWDNSVVEQHTTVDDQNIYNGPVYIERGAPPDAPGRSGSPKQQPRDGEQKRKPQRRRVDPMKGKRPSRGNGRAGQRRSKRNPKPPEDQ